MPRKASPVVVVLLLFVACRDGPTAIGATDLDRWIGTTSASAVLDPLLSVSQLMGDDFVRPLTIQAIGRAAADQLAVALEPPWEELAEPDLMRAIQALSAVRLQLVAQTPQPETDVMKTEGSGSAEDAEALIVKDALSLVVDDVLQVLLAADSTGGG